MNLYKSDGQSSSDFDLSQIFIARDQQMDLFSLYLNRWKRIMAAAPAPDHAVTIAPNPNNKIEGLVVLLYGRGGFGKSTLLQHYRKMALEEDQHLVVSKIVDWEFAIEYKRGLFNPAPGQQVDASDYFKLLCNWLAHALGKESNDFKEYRRAVEAVQKASRDAKNMLDALEKDDRYTWLRKFASEEVVTLLRGAIPGANLVPGIAKIADGATEGLDQAMKIGADQAKQLYTRLSDRLKGKLGDYLEPTLRLGLALGRDLSNFARNFPLLIFFDTYEEVDEGDPLLRLVMAAAGIRVGWVLAGRDNLWGGLEQRRRSLDLEYGYKDIVPADRGLAIDFNVGGVGAFTISDIVEYFAQLSEKRSTQPLVSTITEEEASRILEATQGVPLAIKIAASLYLETPDVELITEKAGKKSEIVDAMTRRYLLHTQSDPDELTKLYGLALLRRAYEPTAISTALKLSPEQAQISYYAELSRLQRRYSFIFTEKDQPSLHQEVRYFLRRWLLEHRDEPEITAVNERLKASHESILKRMEASRQYGSLRDRLEDEEWVGVYLDLTEQQFWLDPVMGVQFLLPFMIAAVFYYRESNVDATEIGTFFAHTIAQPYREWLQWAEQSLPYLYSHNPSDEERAGLESLERIVASQRLPFFTSSLLDDQTELETALWSPLRSDSASSLNSLAMLYHLQGNYKQAQPLYQRVLKIYEEVLGFKHPYTKMARESYTYFLQRMRFVYVPQIEIQAINSSGMLVDKDSEFALHVKNCTETVFDQLTIELLPSAEYFILSPNPLTLLNTQAGQTQEARFRLKMKTPGRIALNCLVNGEMRDPPFYIYAIKDNPYFYGPPAHEMGFVGRQDELDEIMQAISKPLKEDVLLVGERRTGKTSVLYQIKRQLEQPFIPVYIVLNIAEPQTEAILQLIRAQIIHVLVNVFDSEIVCHLIPINQDNLS